MVSLKCIFWNRKKKKPSKSLVRTHPSIVYNSSTECDDKKPTGPIADAFKEYINNEIPARLIHTSKLQFVSRNDVFRVFEERIANVTEEDIQKRIRSLQSDPLATYQPRRETVPGKSSKRSWNTTYYLIGGTRSPVNPLFRIFLLGDSPSPSSRNLPSSARPQGSWDAI